MSSIAIAMFNDQIRALEAQRDEFQNDYNDRIETARSRRDMEAAINSELQAEALQSMIDALRAAMPKH